MKIYWNKIFYLVTSCSWRTYAVNWDPLSFPQEPLSFLSHIAVTRYTSEKQNMELQRSTEHCWAAIPLHHSSSHNLESCSRKQNNKNKQKKAHAFCVQLKKKLMTALLWESIEGYQFDIAYVWSSANTQLNYWQMGISDGLLMILLQRVSVSVFILKQFLFFFSSSFPAVFIPSPWGHNHIWMSGIFLFLLFSFSYSFSVTYLSL